LKRRVGESVPARFRKAGKGGLQDALRFFLKVCWGANYDIPVIVQLRGGQRNAQVSQRGGIDEEGGDERSLLLRARDGLVLVYRIKAPHGRTG